MTSVLLVSICSSANAQAVDQKLYFDGSRAWYHLKAQVAFGPRLTGLIGQTRAVRYFKEVLKANGWKVREQKFSLTIRGKKRNFVNVIADLGEGDNRVLLASHFDTRSVCDNDPNPKRRNGPGTDANNGASNSAVLLALAKSFAEHPPKAPITMVFFDGENYGPGLETMFLGSNWFAKHLSESEVQRYRYGILVDMVGKRNLVITPEYEGQRAAPYVWAKVINAGRELGYYNFSSSPIPHILDDHIPLIEAGIPTIDIIDLEYDYWRTSLDTLDKCSQTSLEQVGRTIELVVRREY